MDLLEKLHEYIKKNNKTEFFTLKLRLSNEEAEFNGRWDTAFLDATLDEYEVQQG